MSKKYTDEQIQTFIRRTNEELALQDPQPVLNDLGIDYKELGNDSYRMNLRGEKTASAYISLKNGMWKYIDFGDRTRGGNIANVVMHATGKDYKAALSYSLQTLGVKNHLEEALNSKRESHELSQADRERIKAQRDANKTREASHPLSKVTTVYEVATNQLAVDYLASRGILKIPPQMKIINGTYTNNKNEERAVYGVGVLTRDGQAGNIHFLSKLGDLKSMSLGQSNISFFQNPNSNKVAVFESKMDYCAAYQQMPLDGVNIIIANSVSNASKVAELLVSEGLTQTPPMMFLQNDFASYRMVADIMEKADIQEVKSIRYQVMSEYKKDINDLLLEGVKIADRIEQRPLEYFEDIAKSLELIQKAQQTPSIDSTRDALRKANFSERTQSQGQER